MVDRLKILGEQFLAHVRLDLRLHGLEALGFIEAMLLGVLLLLLSKAAEHGVEVISLRLTN